MSGGLDDNFALALRGLLVEHVGSSTDSRRVLPRWRGTLALRVGLVVAALAAGGGAAAATGVISLWPPGSPVVTPLAAPVTVTGSGTETITLGPQPAGANGIYLEFRCLSAGDFTFGDGSGEQCAQADAGAGPATETLKLAAGQQTTTITAAAGERWQATVLYVTASVTPWKTNANGQTYGAVNQHGTPDLIAVIATNGRSGYVYAGELNPPPATSPAQALAEQAANTQGVFIPVYESDGSTVIGRYEAAEPGHVP